VMLGATGAFKACDDDRESGGEDPPRTSDDVVAVDGAGATSIAVLSNDTDLDNEPLTLSVEESASVGTASFNADRTLRLDLPSGFRGVTRLRYKVTNSLGGFSVSTAVVFVDVPAYRVAFAARDAAQNYELYVSNLVSAERVSQAVSGNLRLRNMWLADDEEAHSLIVYERADPATPATTAELFYVKTSPIADPVRIPRPASATFIADARVAVSADDRWVAFPTTPSSSGANSLYAFDTGTASATPQLVGISSNLQADSVRWEGDQPSLYYISRPGGLPGPALYRANIGSFDAPIRISPPYAAPDTNVLFRVSPDHTRVLLFGTHNQQNGAFFVDPAQPNAELRLTTDMPPGAVIEAFEIDDGFTELTYLWRSGTNAIARLSVVPIDASGTDPTTVINADINTFWELRGDGAAVLLTRGPGGSTSDGTLFEAPIDDALDGTRIATNVTGGVYDDTGDRVFLFSRTLAPAVIARSDFDRTPTALVRTSTSPSALYVTPATARSVAIVDDATSGLVLVNAAAPGQTIRLTTLAVSPLPNTGNLFPTVIAAP
jgi:hypothetical protein